MKKNGSILVWSMLLSFFVIAFFIWIQSSFKKYMTMNSFFNDNIQSRSKLTDNIDSLSWNPLISLQIDNYLIKSLDFNWSTYSWFLAVNEWNQYWITNSWSDTSINLSIISWWPLNYEIIYTNLWHTVTNTWNTWSIITSSWIDLKFDSTYDLNIVLLTSSWSYSQFSISKWNTDLTPQKSLYRLTRQIWDYDSFIKNFEITNFIPYNL